MTVSGLGPGPGRAESGPARGDRRRVELIGARELAVAMNRQPSWEGDKPLLFFTTATSDDVAVDEPDAAGNTQIKLVDVYDNLTFRFCFTNEQIAKAVLNFVWSRPDLRPATPEYWPLAAVGSSLTAALDRPTVYNLVLGRSVLRRPEFLFQTGDHPVWAQELSISAPLRQVGLTALSVRIRPFTTCLGKMIRFPST